MFKKILTWHLGLWLVLILLNVTLIFICQMYEQTSLQNLLYIRTWKCIIDYPMVGCDLIFYIYWRMFDIVALFISLFWIWIFIELSTSGSTFKWAWLYIKRLTLAQCLYILWYFYCTLINLHLWWPGIRDSFFLS